MLLRGVALLKEADLEKNTLGEKWLALLLLAAFIISFVPCVIIALYNHPSLDDFSFGVLPRLARMNGGSAMDIIAAAAKQVGISYETWQGTFCGIFLMALQPAVFGEQFYFIGALVVYFILIGSTIYAVRTFFYRSLNNCGQAIVCIIIIALSIHFLPSPVEAFYWYNSAMYYTGFYSLSLVLLCFSYKHMKADGNSIAGSALLVIGSFCIGGGNYVTALLYTELMLCLCIYSFYKKSAFRVTMLLAVISVAAGLAISALAPGNAVRAEFFNGWPFVQAIIQAFKNGIIYIVEYSTKPPVILCIASLYPFLARAAGVSKISFKYPVIVLGISFCIFCSQYAPTLYGTGGMGGGRVQNIRFFSYIWYMIFNIYYVTGWYAKKREAVSNREAGGKTGFKFSIAAIILALITLPLTGWANVTGISAARSLLSGQASAYHLEQLSREEMLRSDNMKIELPRLSSKPYVLFFADVSKDEDGNRGICEFYGKESVVLR